MEKILYYKEKSAKRRPALPYPVRRTSKLKDVLKKDYHLVIVDESLLKKSRKPSPSYFKNKICFLRCPKATRSSANLVRQFGFFDYFSDTDSKRDIMFKLKKAAQFYELQKKAAHLEDALLERDSKIQEMALVDPLTGCYNWRYFLNRVNQEINRSRRHLHDISFVGIDIDHFRHINEIYGVRVADSVIKELVEILRCRLRKEDVLIRWREDEFFIIMPYLSHRNAYKVAQRIKGTIASYRFKYKNIRLTVKASIGVVSLSQGNVTNARDIIGALNRCLVAAKRKGGNTIVLYSQSRLKGIAKEAMASNLGDLQSKIEKMNALLTRDLLEMIYGFARAIEAKDSYTGRHVEYTAILAKELAASLNLPKKDIDDIQHAAVLHDLGKVGINENILSKKGVLTPKEREVIKTHPSIAAEILREIHSLRGAVPAILYHHERYDGKGYPLGLKGDEIPLSARIVAVADVYQALISDRPYRKAYSKKKSLQIIKKESGKQFDPKIVKVFLKVVKKINEKI
jgi:diguanylate cyclase (GGDEF)-like protein